MAVATSCDSQALGRLRVLAAAAHEQFSRRPVYYEFKQILEQRIMQPDFRLSEVETLCKTFLNEFTGAGAQVSNYAISRFGREATIIGTSRRTSCTAARAAETRIEYPGYLLPPEPDATGSPVFIPAPREQHAGIEAARKMIESTMRRRLNRLALEFKVPLAQARPVESLRAAEESAAKAMGFAQDPKEDAFLKAAAGADPDVISSYSSCYLYDDADLLEAICGIRGNSDDECAQNRCPGAAPDIWNSMPLHFVCPTMDELRARYMELAPGHAQCSVDDVYGDPAKADAFLASHVKLGERICRSRSVAAALQFAKRGVHPSLRPSIWRILLLEDFAVVGSDQLQRHIRKLHAAVRSHDLAVDRLVQIDARRLQDDEAYFVFEEMVGQMLLLWTRDPRLHSERGSFDMDAASVALGARTPAFPRNGRLAGSVAASYEPARGLNQEGTETSLEVYPPNGILPFRGLAQLAAPFCFTSRSTDDAYLLFREAYARYFCHIHTLSSHAEGIIALLSRFETLLQRTDPQVYFHLRHGLASSPLKYAHSWMSRAFVGTLESEQVLCLWDRVFGYGGVSAECGLDLLPITAAALFVWRRAELLAAENEREVETAFGDVQSIGVVPLLQYFLFHTT